jgi:hypothetical protein
VVTDSATRGFAVPGGNTPPHAQTVTSHYDQDEKGSLSPARPVTLSRRATDTAKLADNLTVLHRQLLSAYANSLNYIEALPGYFNAAGRKYTIIPNHRFRVLRCLRFLVRFNTEAHIRRRLRDLAKIYTRRQFSSVVTLSDSSNKRLSGLSEECDEFAKSLSGNSRRIAIVVTALTIIAPVIPLILRGNPQSLYSLLRIFLAYLSAAIIFLPGTIVVFAYSDAFRFKRQLFGADLPLLSFDTSKSIYDIEDKLYNSLGQPKRPEGASDLWIRAGAIAIVCISFGIVFFGPARSQIEGLFWVSLIAAIIFPTWSLIKGIWHRRRASR